MRSFLFIIAAGAVFYVVACTDPAPPVAVNSTPSRPAATPTVAAADDHGHEDTAPRISLADAKKAFDAGTAVIIDVRDEMAYKQEHIKGALNIPTAQLDAKADTIPKGKKVIAYCS